ncbi:uncharacterized protein LOC106153529 [Lingula anatina]|uniref:Uncharacterized protein LOC106153529 n=1 Tax=Lingula anatina TaxID=7574 RepID=A0A1S3HCW1_LINAN|nr:uncharacterized protein LOC106153529 [Lingula anatina]|eukprot:XP_013382959.1 uncharacterized protein LOC106153529 [Lingula anatina]
MSEYKEFLENPTIEELQKFKKADLIAICKILEADVQTSMSKSQLKEIIINISDIDLPLSSSSDKDAKKAKPDIESEIMLKELDIELKKLDIAKIEKENETLELKVRLRKIELEARDNHSSSFTNCSQQLRFVPPFNEREVDKFFMHFEKVAKNLEWPIDKWCIMLQSVLTGKAQETYAAISLEDSGNYEKVKHSILKAYELVPEAYRQQFRELYKRDDQTFIEFAREKEMLFDRWCRSRDVGSNFEKLKQMILVEEFKECVSDSLKVHIEESHVDSLEGIATIADNYALTHKNFSKSKKAMEKVSPSQTLSHLNEFPRNFPRTERREDAGSKAFLGPFCNFCKKRGHVLSECWTLQRKKENETLKSNALVSFPVTDFRDATQKDEDRFLPFISDGYVSLENNPSDMKPIKILRDTGASQSLLLEGVLPLDENSDTGEQVLAQGIECGFLNVPLHQIHLKSDLVSGPVIVGVRPSLPIKGVTLLLGNDLAGGKVIADPIVCKDPHAHLENEVESERSCSVNVLTRAMSKTDEKKNEMEGIIDECVDDDGENELDVESSELQHPENDLVTEQRKDADLAKLFKLVLSEVEIKKSLVDILYETEY